MRVFMKKIGKGLLKILSCVLGFELFLGGIGGIIVCFHAQNIFSVLFYIIFSLLFLSGGIFLLRIGFRKTGIDKSLKKTKGIKDSNSYCENQAYKKELGAHVSEEQPTTYMETANTIYRTDGEFISDKEVPYLIQTGQEKAIAKWKIPELERQIKESYQLMCTTNNPETLCSRYKFIVEKINELAYFQQKGLFDKDSFVQYNALITDDNYCNLILTCYTKYVNKARSELTTEKGVNNRINKFLKIIRQNVNAEFYNKMFLTKISQ